MRHLTYLTFDSLQEGVGASQALAYVLKIAEGREVTLISFEKTELSKELDEILTNSKVEWIPLKFGKFGVFGGLSRVIRMSRKIERNSIVHARGNLAAISALVRFPYKWIWDCRSMHADQRRSISSGIKSKFVYIIMRLFELMLAKFSSRIIVITDAVKSEFVSRYGIPFGKMEKISTCTDTSKFAKNEIPSTKIVRILLSGTFSPAYDLILTNKIIDEMRKHVPLHITVAASIGATSSWKDIPYDEYLSVPHKKMPELIANSHLGFSILKNDLGVCLKSVASTKTAEFLSSGRPLFVNSNQGDFKRLFDYYEIGVVTDGDDQKSVTRYVNEMISLLSDKETPGKCRKVAEDNFSLDDGVAKLLKIYKELD
jgi:glycosyltransferase involved in cell wall biosynthesis